MEITCAQMEVLISFYLEDDLSTVLKSKVEEHLAICPNCRAKYNIIKSMLDDLRNTYVNSKPEEEFLEDSIDDKTLTSQYQIFKNNISAYLDNELSNDENIKIKKFAINNKQARQELEDICNIRKLMSDSYKKTQADLKHDFSQKVLRQLEPDYEYNFKLNPLIKVGLAFVITVLVISAIVFWLLIR